MLAAYRADTDSGPRGRALVESEQNGSGGNIRPPLPRRPFLELVPICDAPEN